MGPVGDFLDSKKTAFGSDISKFVIPHEHLEVLGILMMYVLFFFPGREVYNISPAINSSLLSQKNGIPMNQLPGTLG